MFSVSTTEIILYRNPAEKIWWDSILNIGNSDIVTSTLAFVIYYGKPALFYYLIVALTVAIISEIIDIRRDSTFNGIMDSIVIGLKWPIWILYKICEVFNFLFFGKN